MTFDADLVRKKFQQLLDEVKAELVDRDDEIEALGIAVLARAHVYFLSEMAGTGKSWLIEQFVRRISGARLVERQMFPTATFEYLFGPQMLTKLREDRYVYNTAGFAAEADILHLGEAGTISEAMAITLLDLLNERKFVNDGQTIRVPLSTAILDSNQLLPDGNPTLKAVWDRISIRLQTGDLDDAGLLRMLRSKTLPSAPVQPVIDWGEVQAAVDHVAAVPVSDDALLKLAEIRRKLRSELSIYPSPRRMGWALPLGQAQAFLHGDDEVRPEHWEILRHFFWDRPEQAHDVERIVTEATNPAIKKVLDLADKVPAAAARLDEAIAETDEVKQAGLGVTAIRTIRSTASEVRRLRPNVTGRAARVLDDTWRRLEELSDRFYVEIQKFAKYPTLGDDLDQAGK